MGWGFQAGGELTDLILILATTGKYCMHVYLIVGVFPFMLLYPVCTCMHFNIMLVL